MLVTISALIFCILILLTIIFQFALAFGASWGEYSMGGRYPGKFPTAMRILSLFQILILILIGAIVLTKADLILHERYPVSETAIWFVVAFTAISIIINTITPSKKERKIWAPVTVLLFATALIVALN
jgi:hypothetical protein